jgi:hypothetical protein
MRKPPEPDQPVFVKVVPKRNSNPLAGIKKEFEQELTALVKKFSADNGITVEKLMLRYPTMPEQTKVVVKLGRL